MVGDQLARRIRALPGGPEIFLIALTGYGREEDRTAALEASFDRHLVKPITLRQIEELLAAMAPHSPTSAHGTGHTNCALHADSASHVRKVRRAAFAGNRNCARPWRGNLHRRRFNLARRHPAN